MTKPKPKAAPKAKAKRPPPKLPRKVRPSQHNAKIPDDVRAFIIMGFARYSRTSDIQKAVLEEFGLELDSRTLSNHMLDRPSRASAMGLRWVKLFDDTRKAFIEQIDAIPITHPAYRLSKLQRYFDILDAKDAIGPATAVLEQAAKESGGAFTNKRTIDGKVKVEEAEALDSTEQRAVLTAAIEDALRLVIEEKQANQPTIQ